MQSAATLPGWLLFNRSKLVLHSAAFTGGAPELMIELVPIQISKKRGLEFERWKFDGDEVWLRCAYGKGGQVTLSKKVDGEPTECTVSYSHKLPLKIVCT